MLYNSFLVDAASTNTTTEAVLGRLFLCYKSANYLGITSVVVH